MKPLVFEGEARSEYLDAVERYGAENPVAAARFVELVEATIEGIHGAPHRWPLDPTVPARFGARRQRIEGFPYSVVYVETAGAIHVLAVSHGKREPGFWRSRMPTEPR